MSCPSAIGVRSTSIGAPAAMVEASGFIWETNGQSEATPPTAAKAPVATNRKSRRVGCSAEDAVVTIPNPFISCTRRNRPGKPPGRLPAPATPAAAERPPISDPIGDKEQSRIVLLAPLPDERKPAIGCPTCNALIPRTTAFFRISRRRSPCELDVTLDCPDANVWNRHADRALPARHSPKHRHHPQALRLYRRRRPHHRARGFSRIGPEFSPRRDGLS